MEWPFARRGREPVALSSYSAVLELSLSNCRFPSPIAMKTSTLSSTGQIPETLPRTKKQEQPDSAADVLIVGAGPTGMACAIETQKAGFKALIIDKGCLVNSIYNYPT